MLTSKFIVPTLLGIGSRFVFGEQLVLADKLSRDLYLVKEEPRKIPRGVERKQNYPGHVHLGPIERGLLIAGSSIGAFLDPSHNEFIVGLGESTLFEFVLRRIRRQMLNSSTGRLILKERPRITSQSLDLHYLRSLPSNSVGNQYVQWLDREKVSPDTRVQVRFIDDEELLYVFQRYRECHDFYHALTGLPVVREGEIALKWLEFLNLGIPMTGLGAIFAPWNTDGAQRKRLFSIYYPWLLRNLSRCKPLINVYWERELERDVDDLRLELHLEKPPDMRSLRKLLKRGAKK